MSEERITLTDQLQEICRRLDVPYSYVRELKLHPTDASVTLLKGRNGRGQGEKYVDLETGEPATETLRFKIRS